MRSDKKQARHDAIIAAAYAILAEKGYSGTSMLSIAKAAKASNETLYRWYGDKRGLFVAMVRDNAAATKAALEDAIDAEGDPRVRLAAFSPIFMRMILGDRAIALNRAAAADPDAALGAAISDGGRNEIAPLFTTLMGRIRAREGITPADMTTWYIGLLVGDLQIKRVIGVLAAPTPAEIDARCDQALDAFFRLIGPDTSQSEKAKETGSLP